MGPKKEKGKKEEENTNFTEVDRTFMELQLAECNRKIARLRTAVDEFEARNEELQQAYDKLDEDRADIIAYLKKALAIKNEENNELKEKVKGLEEIREIENAQFHATVASLEKDFTMMKDQLTSENKLLAGKINTLEEFRAIRDDLMKKFEQQEEDFKNQEMKYKRIIYNAEKKFVIGKDKLKKEMEARLLQLAQDFQDATELRIAASTHRVIRENIAISNELDNILTSQQKVANQNETFKEYVRAATIAKELAEEERDKAINKSVVQLKVIEQLTAAFENVSKEKGQFEKKSYDFEALQSKIQKLTKDNDELVQKVRILEQNLHAKLSEQNKSVMEASKMSKERNALREILKEAAFAIQAALKLDQWAQADPARDAVDRQFLLSHLLEIVSQYREVQMSESLATVASFSKVYEEGDLGFVPKSSIKKKTSRPAVTSAEQLQKQSDSVQFTDKQSISSDTATTSILSSSIPTIPEIKILPESSMQQISEEKSLESFVTSDQTSQSEEQEIEFEDHAKAEVEQKLLASKLEIQKSVMKDLMDSQLSYKMSRAQMSQKASDINLMGKMSVIGKQSIQDIEVVEEVIELQTEVEDDDGKEGGEGDKDKEESKEPIETEPMPASEKDISDESLDEEGKEQVEKDAF